MSMLQAFARRVVRDRCAGAAMLRAVPRSSSPAGNRFFVSSVRIFLLPSGTSNSSRTSRLPLLAIALQPARRLLTSTAEKVVTTPPPSLWQRINARVNRIPKSIRIGIRVIRVGVLALTLYALGKAEGMAEYATDPDGYRRSITLQVAQQFVAEGKTLQDTIVSGETEARVTRIMAKVIDGAQKSLDRLHKAETDPKEKERLDRAQVRTESRKSAKKQKKKKKTSRSVNNCSLLFTLSFAFLFCFGPARRLQPPTATTHSLNNNNTHRHRRHPPPQNQQPSSPPLPPTPHPTRRKEMK
jgi:hypothetical protein